MLSLLEDAYQINDIGGTFRSLAIQPIRILVVFDDSTLVDLGVGDSEFSHGVGGELVDTSLLNKHVTVLTYLLCRPVSNTLFLMYTGQYAESIMLVKVVKLTIDYSKDWLSLNILLAKKNRGYKGKYLHSS